MATPAVSLRAEYTDHRDLLAAFTVDGPRLTIFAPTPVMLASGSACELGIVVAEPAERHVLHGTVVSAWRRRRGAHTESGLVVSFNGEAKAAAARLYARAAGRPASWGTALEQRFRVSIGCRLKLGGGVQRAEVRDLSATGAFAALPSAALRPGTDVVVVFPGVFLGLGARKVPARIIWAGKKGGQEGVGLRFLVPSSTIRPLLRRFAKDAPAPSRSAPPPKRTAFVALPA